jgi:hypothetical protein
MDFELLKSNFLAFSSISGDERGDRAFSESVHGENGIAWKFVGAVPKGNYGTALDLILIMLSIEGSHDWFKMPPTRKLGPYAEKQRAIRFAVPIRSAELELMEGNQAQKNFLFGDILSTLAEAINKKKFPPTFDFDKQAFLIDLNSVIASLKS